MPCCRRLHEGPAAEPSIIAPRAGYCAANAASSEPAGSDIVGRLQRGNRPLQCGQLVGELAEQRRRGRALGAHLRHRRRVLRGTVGDLADEAILERLLALNLERAPASRDA
jgi:hypothetical protein